MDIREYEELFGKYEEQLEDSSEIIYRYATKEMCERVAKSNKQHKRKGMKIPERCKICENCDSFNRYWYACDDYDCYCQNYKNTWSRNRFGYREVKEDDSCDYWEWNGWQLVDPETNSTLDASLYEGYNPNVL